MQVTGNQAYSRQVKTAEYLSDKTITFTLDGTKKTVSLEDVLKDDSGWITDNEAFVENLNDALDKAFGTGKITTSVDGNGKLSFTVQEGSTFAVSSEVGEALKIGSGGLTSYVDTSKTLGELGTFDAKSGKLNINGTVVTGRLMEVVPKSEWIEQKDGSYTDASGYKLDAEGYRLSQDGERLYEFDLNINGVKVGTFTQDTAFETVINSINSNTEAGVNVSYSKLTNQFVFHKDWNSSS